MDSVTLAGALEFARATNLPLHSVTVIRNGSLVLDTYFLPVNWDGSTTWLPSQNNATSNGVQGALKSLS